MSHVLDQRPNETEAAAVAEGADATAIEWLNAEGIRLANEGKLREAIRVFERALSVDARNPQSLHNLGVAYAELGELERATASFRAAIDSWPQYVEGHCGLANTLATRGQYDEACDHYRTALGLRPDSAGALNGLGLALVSLKRFGEAAVYLEEAARLEPEAPGAHANLGLALAEDGEYARAEAAFREALRLDPRYAEAHTNIGNVQKEQGLLERALACYQLALWFKPNSTTARWNRSLALLQSGDYERGWREYESRWSRAPMRRQVSQPMWDGSPLAGRTILVHMEQGLGDAIMFVRYCALLKAQGATVLAEYPPPLARILPTYAGVDRWLPEGAALPSFDVHAPVMSLPHLCGTRMNNVPVAVPYLSADDYAADRWRRRLAERRGLRVGVAWQGNPHHPWDRHRSVRLSRFAPLAAVPGVRLISLQRGPGVEQLSAALPDGMQVEDVLDRGLDDAAGMMELAALLKTLDLVVTVDTATAHVAGALGVPVWVVLSTMVDWRWMLERTDTPWYPSMRLFRQRRRGEWDPVFADVARALADLASRDPAPPPEG